MRTGSGPAGPGMVRSSIRSTCSGLPTAVARRARRLRRATSGGTRGGGGGGAAPGALLEDCLRLRVECHAACTSLRGPYSTSRAVGWPRSARGGEAWLAGAPCRGGAARLLEEMIFITTTDAHLLHRFPCSLPATRT